MHMAQAHDTRLPRAQRRAILGDSNTLDVVLVSAGADISAHEHAERIAPAIAALFRSAGAASCFSCREPLSAKRTFGGILIAFASGRPRAVVTSPACASCWSEPITEELSRHAERALRRIVIGGRWLDPAPPDSG